MGQVEELGGTKPMMKGGMSMDHTSQADHELKVTKIPEASDSTSNSRSGLFSIQVVSDDSIISPEEKVNDVAGEIEVEPVKIINFNCNPKSKMVKGRNGKGRVICMRAVDFLVKPLHRVIRKKATKKRGRPKKCLKVSKMTRESKVTIQEMEENDPSEVQDQRKVEEEENQRGPLELVTVQHKGNPKLLVEAVLTTKIGKEMGIKFARSDEEVTRKLLEIGEEEVTQD